MTILKFTAFILACVVCGPIAAVCLTIGNAAAAVIRLAGDMRA